jgi:hypothetical protein
MKLNFKMWVLGAFLTCGLSPGAYAVVPFPQLFFRYSWLFDSECAEWSKREVKPEWAQEARELTPHFTEVWNSEASGLFGAVFAEFRKGFSRTEYTATLSVCSSASFSDPLVLNVTRFLKSFQGERPVRPDYVFADLVFHELLHTWMMENLDWRNSLLLMKYKDELQVIKNHLHLMAMQRFIYQKLGRTDLSGWLAESYPRMGPYARAWEIVDKIEGHEPFISEIHGPIP